MNEDIKKVLELKDCEINQQPKTQDTNEPLINILKGIGWLNFGASIIVSIVIYNKYGVIESLNKWGFNEKVMNPQILSICIQMFIGSFVLLIMMLSIARVLEYCVFFKKKLNEK